MVERVVAEQPADDGAKWPCPLERGDRRQAIIDAARAIASARGFDAVTFTAVAEAMGFAPSTVYGYFATRQELLSQISFDDAPEVESVESAAQSEPASSPVPVPDAAAEPVRKTSAINDWLTTPENPDNAKPAEPSSRTKAENDYGDLLKAQAEELDKLAKNIIVPGAKLREGTDAALAKLETRLKVVEQSYTDLEQRRAQDSEELRRKLETSEETAKLLQHRLEEAETRHRAAVAELRLSLYNLENPDAGKASYVPPPETDIAFDPTPEQTHTDGIAGQGMRHPYLASARSSAIENGFASAGPEWTTFHMPRFGRRAKLAAAMGLIVCAVSVGAWRIMPAGMFSSPPVVQPADRLTTLAEGGNADAMLLVGVKLLNGEGSTKDEPRAAGWLKRAAARGQPMAQNYLGVLHRTGAGGVDASIPQAVHWFEAAALQGNRMAMANLGKIYAGGWAQGVDFRRAARWFVRAAMLGDTDSAFNLGVLYERGDGVMASRFDAYKWYSIAAAAGDQPAAKRARELARLLSPQELATANVLAAEFKPLVPDRAANALPDL